MAHLLQLLLILVLIVLASKLAGALSVRLGQPAVFGELLSGLVLGPSFLNILGWNSFSDPTLPVTVKDMAELGVIFLMFLAGMETDLGEMRKVGLAATLGATGGVVVPWVTGTALSLAFGFSFPESLFIGVILTATSVSISAQTLMELGKLRSKVGTTILGGAVIDDVMGIIALSLVVAFYGGGAGGAGGTGAQAGSGAGASAVGGIWVVTIKMVLYFVVAIVAGNWLLPRATALMDRLPATEMVLAWALAVGLFYAWAAQAFGQVAAITGAYIAGVLFAQTKFHHYLAERLRIVAYSLFVPIFFASIGLDADIHTLGSNLAYTVLIILVAIVAKVVGGGLGARAAGMTGADSFRFGIGMVSRGEVALIVSGIGLSSGVIDNRIFSVMVIMTLATTLVTPVLLRAAFSRDAKS